MGGRKKKSDDDVISMEVRQLRWRGKITSTSATSRIKRGRYSRAEQQKRRKSVGFKAFSGFKNGRKQTRVTRLFL